MRVGPLTYDASLAAVQRRLSEYGGHDAYAPVPPESFEFLYRALNQNLRDAMAYAQQFSEWLYGDFVVPDKELPDEDQRKSLLEIWLAELADGAYNDARGIARRHWQFFDQLAENGGICRLSEFETYFTRQPNLSTAVTALESVNLLVR